MGNDEWNAVVFNGMSEKESNHLCITLADTAQEISVRACSVSPRVRTALSDFVPDEGDFTPPYFRIASEIHEIWRKICKRDVREGIRRQALSTESD